MFSALRKGTVVSFQFTELPKTLIFASGLHQYLWRRKRERGTRNIVTVS